MSTIHNSNAACCSIPPVQSDYTPKGSFKPYAGFSKAYITGSESATTALVCVYDIFGFWPQTEQGADILASSLNAKVVMPDFFEPNEPFPSENFPPTTDEGKQALQEFFGGPANIGETVPKVKKVAEQLKKDGATKVGAYGFCWGAKVVTLTGSSDVFDAIASIHPAMLSADDVKDLAVPIAVFPSKDEPASEYEKVVKVISEKPFASKNAYKYYDTVHHGWAAARADLKDPENLKQFEDVYSRIAGFFEGVWGHKH